MFILNCREHKETKLQLLHYHLLIIDIATWYIIIFRLEVFNFYLYVTRQLSGEQIIVS